MTLSITLSLALSLTLSISTRCISDLVTLTTLCILTLSSWSSIRFSLGLTSICISLILICCVVSLLIIHIIFIILLDDLTIFSIYSSHCFRLVSFCYFSSVRSVFGGLITFLLYMSSTIVCIKLSMVLVTLILIIQHVFIKILIKDLRIF